MTTSLLSVLAFLLFAALMTVLSYHLSRAKVANRKAAAGIGLLLSFMPPFAIIYIAVLAFKPEREELKE